MLAVFVAALLVASATAAPVAAPKPDAKADPHYWGGPVISYAPAYTPYIAAPIAPYAVAVPSPAYISPYSYYGGKMKTNTRFLL